MTARDLQWEYGGDVQWPKGAEMKRLLCRENGVSSFSKGVFFGTGRAAILALLEHGKATRGWRRLLVPSCFCPRVVERIESSGWICERYADSPLASPRGLPTAIEAGDVLLRMNFFGWRSGDAVGDTAGMDCDVIEDHSHDPFGPWARGSRASYCVVSLRKTMPVPDGGWVWSPSNEQLPAEVPPSESHLIAAGFKIAGMILKQHYREGIPIPKSGFRELLVRGEALLGEGSPGGMHPLSKTILEQLSPQTLARRRMENFRALLECSPAIAQLSPVAGLPSECTPFALVMVFNSLSERERMRRELIERAIYPSILWTLPNAMDPETVDFGNRSLALPCHHYFSCRDRDKIASTLRPLV